jgi:hypothetical protein
LDFAVRSVVCERDEEPESSSAKAKLEKSKPDKKLSKDADPANNAVVPRPKTGGLLLRMGAAFALLAELLLSHLSLLV